jgi:hypothetical protein
MVCVRKNHLAMTAEEKRRFVRAIREIKRRGVYDELVRIHMEINSRDYIDKDSGLRTAHLSPAFLTWHRQYLLIFERALQRIDPSLTVPYWDWTTDQSPSSPLWAEDFMGGDGRELDGQVMTGPFAYRNGWVLNISVVPDGTEQPPFMGHYTTDDRRYLVREFGKTGEPLSTPTQLADTLALPVYDCPPWNYTSGRQAPYPSFRNHLEGFTRFPWDGPGRSKLHGSGHLWVGGHMHYLGSPNDPVFFLHHCFIDKCWAMWQQQHPDVPHYLPVERHPDVPGLHSKLPPWRTMSAADLIDHTRFYRYQ